MLSKDFTTQAEGFICSFLLAWFLLIITKIIIILALYSCCRLAIICIAIFILLFIFFHLGIYVMKVFDSSNLLPDDLYFLIGHFLLFLAQVLLHSCAIDIWSHVTGFPCSTSLEVLGDVLGTNFVLVVLLKHVVP